MDKLRTLIMALGLALLASCRQEAGDMPPESGELSFSVQTAGSSVKAEAPAGAFRAVALERVQTLAEGDTLRLYAQEEAFPLADTPSTKASVYTGTSLPTDVSLGLMAYKYATAGSAISQWTLHTSPAVMEAVYDGSRSAYSKKWVPTVRLFWPGSGCVRYFAYAPYGASGATVTAASGSAPQIAYTVPPSHDGQVDLLVSNAASSCEYDGDPLVTAIDVPMTLQHALTGIRFRVEKGMTITSVSVTGVLNKGTLPLWGSGSHTWSPDALSTGSYTLTSPQLKTDPSNDSYLVTEDAYTLMLLPQTLPEGARIEATVSGGGNSKTITAVMDGEIWPAGKLITYTITTLGNVTPTNYIYDYTLDDVPDITLTGYERTGGAIRNVTVKSYRSAENHPSEAVAWKLMALSSGGEYVEHTDPAWPEWLEFSAYSGEGSVTGQELKATIDANRIAGGGSVSNVASSGNGAGMIATLRNAAFVGSKEAPRDLSLYDIYGNAHPGGVVTSITASGSHTANSYVVSAPGYYCFPLVYGNAIDKTRGNSSGVYDAAFKSKRSVGYVNADNNAIASPYILSDTNLSRTDNLEAVVVWQDVERGWEIVKNIRCSIIDAPAGAGLGCKYIRFLVDQRDILPGNVVIALRDKGNAGKVLWSWHIWVTAVPHASSTDDFSIRNLLYRTSNTTTAPTASVDLLNCNLGWTPPLKFTAGSTVARSTTVKIVQTEGAADPVTFNISQPSATSNAYTGVYYAHPFYQWGRKDPMLPSRGDGNYNKSVCSDYYTIVTDALRVTWDDMEKNVHKWILNPAVFDGGAADAFPRYDLWNANNSGNSLPTDNTAAAMTQNVAKTVYDPSPAGFSVPMGRAFTAFTSNGNVADPEESGTANPYASEQTPSSLTARNYSFRFTYNGSSSSSTYTLYFPESGMRHYSAMTTTDEKMLIGALNHVSGYYRGGYYWTAVPYGANFRGSALYFGNFRDLWNYIYDLNLTSPQLYINPNSASYGSYGMSVRPALEK